MSSSANIPATPTHRYELGTNSSRHREAATQSQTASFAARTGPPAGSQTRHHQLNLPMWHFAAPTRASAARAEATKAKMASKLHMTASGTLPPNSPPGNNTKSRRVSLGSPGGGVVPNNSDIGNKTPSRKMPARQKLQLLRTPVMKLPESAGYSVGEGGEGDREIAALTAHAVGNGGIDGMHMDGGIDHDTHSRTTDDENFDEIKIGEAQ